MNYRVWLVALLGLMPMSVCMAGYYDSLTKNDQNVITTNDITQDPFRQGAYNPGSNVKWLYGNGQITTFLQAQNQTIAYIQNIVNWTLSIIWLVALIYLLYNGFLMVTSAGDEWQFKKWFAALKTAAIALVGIGLSALVVNLILYLIARIV